MLVWFGLALPEEGLLKCAGAQGFSVGEPTRVSSYLISNKIIAYMELVLWRGQ